MVYLLQLQSIERRWAVLAQAAAAARAAGGEVSFPDLDDVLADFDDWLFTAPPDVDPAEGALTRALGVA